jgi:TolB-like protein/Tfp pilus assembly protein PilF
MTKKSNSFERFWKELKRRKVIHVITVYAAVSFVILQLVDIVERPLRLPDWTTALVIVLLCIGFVIAAFLSWIYDITPAGVKKTKPVRELKHSDHTTHTVSSGWKIATYASGIVIIALVAYDFVSRRNLNADISRLEKSIAVLPFRNESPDTTNAYFINGIMERITTNLQMVKEFRVVSRNSVEKYRNNKNKSTPEIAKELDVSYIIEGSGQKIGNSISVTTQLIKGKGKETRLWAKTYDQEIKEVNDYFKIQSEIAEKIAEALKTVIAPEEKLLIEKVPTSSLSADDFYQRGKEEERKFSLTNLSAFSEFSIGSTDNPSNLKAIEIAKKMYNTALKYDSTFALAYVGLASVYWNKNYYKEYFSGNFLDSVIILAKKALLFDDQLSDAYYIQGMYYSERGSNKRALVEFDKALEYNPNYWLAYVGKGDIKSLQIASSLNHGPELPYIIGSLVLSYTDAGFIEIAKNNLENLKLIGEPIQYYRCAGYSEAKQGHGKKALEFYSKMYDIDPTNMWSLEGLGELYSFNGQFEESLKYYKKLVEMQKTSGQLAFISSHRIGYVYFKNGYKKEAEYYFEKQIEYCNGQIKLNRPWAQELYPYYDLAGVYAFKGDKVKAYKNLKTYNQRQEPEGLWMVSLIKSDPLFNSIRNEPEFQQIVRDVEARYQAYHESMKKLLEEKGML